MSQAVSQLPHLFDVARRPSLESEVKRAILASWADRAAVEGDPPRRSPPGMRRRLPIDEISAAPGSIDREEEPGEASLP